MDNPNNPLNLIVYSIYGQELSLGQVLFLPALFIIGYLSLSALSRLLGRRMRKHAVNPDIIHLTRRILFFVGFAVLVITALDFINVPLTAFAFVSGAVAIGVGFGAQNIINNFISGWILLWERPIRIGDFLEIEQTTGTVESINTRSTRIKRSDGVQMIIPNSALLEKTVVNWTLIDKITRTRVRVGVAYGSPVQRVSELIMQAIVEHEAILKEPLPLVIFEDFGDSALIFDAYFWIQASVERDLRVIRSDIRYRLVELFDEAGIVIAYPQQDVHIDGQIALVEAGRPLHGA